MPKQSNPLIKNALLSVLTFLKHKAEEQDLRPVITVSKLLELLPSGIKITYQQLVDLTKDPNIAKSIKSINKNQLELRLGSDEFDEDPVSAPAPEPKQPEENDGDNENFPEDDEEDYNPDDFSFDEEPASFEAPPEESMRPRPDIVKQMAKRAASRA